MALICPLILVWGIITADINTKKVYLNKTVKVVETGKEGDVYVLGKRINKKYLEWTKYPAYIGEKFVPKTIGFAVKALKSKIT